MGSKTEVGFRPVQGQSQLSRQGQVGRRKGSESGKEQVCGVRFIELDKAVVHVIRLATFL